ncbi:GNAT family N-acetyltransferase [Pseudonocardia bannensis]|uniref:GNAT family N-acetyltransferase n=1 Tax=Pseudonocardia bannensis TaxID=630973 RepID=A0A848DET6_9PSEU|nr:GNAT family N-acetyltransferase [Pseudonocardia bannensis]NMH91132.1 GNAT family N-acetyltransferase [Pseudonocardia bannensis]
MTTLDVVAVDPRTDPCWHGLAAGPHGSLFTAPGWISAICETYGFTPEGRLAVDSDGRVLGGFAWVPVRDIRGERLLSLPFSDRAEPPLVDPTTWPVLAGPALAAGPHLTVRCLDGAAPTTDPRFTEVGEAAWHGTPLGPSPDELRSRFHPSVRRNIATAEREEVRVVTSTSLESVRVYHGLHVALRRHKYRLLAQPLAFFEQVWKNFAADNAIVTAIAYLEGRPIAGAIYLVWQDVLYYKFGASLAGYLSVRPNDAVHWAAIQWATDRGLGLLDWGLSDLTQSGLVAYKRKWASFERRIATLSSGERERNAEADDLLTEITKLFVADGVSDEITTRAGALLYRYFC